MVEGITTSLDTVARVVPASTTRQPALGSVLGTQLCWVTQLKAQGPSRTCHESKEEEEEGSSVLCLANQGTACLSLRLKDLLGPVTGVKQKKHALVRAGPGTPPSELGSRVTTGP